MQTLADQGYRNAIITEILGMENINRKRESFKRLEVYSKRQAPYIELKLKQEFDAKSVSDMRKVLSINIAKRITDKMAALYDHPPKRTFLDEQGNKLSEEQVKYIEMSYDDAKFDTKLKRANRIKKFQGQAVIQVLPVRDCIDMRVYHPHQIDCVPMIDDPEKPFAFVISAYDRSNSLIGTGDGADQRISDVNDRERETRQKMRFVWWSDEHNMITNGLGEIVQEDPTDILNPIGILPFVDVPDEKENEFWVRKGSSVIDFAIDFGVLLSDHANINRLQCYAQGVISASAQPADVRVGPQNFLFLQQDPNSTIQPSFQFVSPSPNMDSSLKMLESYLSYFMTAEGIDPKIVNAKGDGPKYSSGFERMLAMIEGFEASHDDIDLFSCVEQEVFELFIAWTNALQGTADNPLEIKGPSLPDADVQVKFHSPEMLQPKADIEKSAILMLEAELSSPVQAIMEIKDLDEDGAKEWLKKRDAHLLEFPKITVPEPMVVPIPKLPGESKVQSAAGLAPVADPGASVANDKGNMPGAAA